MTQVYYTQKAKEIPPCGAFDDEVIFRVRERSESFVMRKYEFEWLVPLQQSKGLSHQWKKRSITRKKKTYSNYFSFWKGINTSK